MESIINCKNFGDADIVLVAANYDKTSSFGKGADKAPVEIKICLDTQIEFFDRYSRSVPRNKKKIFYSDLGNLNSLSPEKMVARVSGEVKKILLQNKFPIIIGGEHSVTNGAIEAITGKGKASEITIVQIDAHFDLRMDDSDYNDKPYGKYAHSAVMRRASEKGFNIVQVGIRAYSKDEFDYAKKSSRIRFFEWGNVNSKGGLFVQPSFADIIKAITTKKVYLTIDVDGFDPSVMSETGTPVPGGFSWNYGALLINKIFQNRDVIGADVVEVAPSSKVSQTAYNAAQLIYNMIGQRK